MTTTEKQTIQTGDRVRVIEPHLEAGAIGTVAYIILTKNGKVARVEFGEPYPGSHTFAFEFLEVVR